MGRRKRSLGLFLLFNVMAIDISGIFLFMPIFSFLFVFFIVYALLIKTKVLGESNFVNLFISLIMAIIFMSFSSLDLYVQTLVPWFIVLLVCVFMILLLVGFSSGKLENVMSQRFFGWVVVLILLSIFLIAAIRVFNPIFHPDLIITSGEGTSLIEQLRFAADGRVFGTILLLVIAGLVSWILTRK